MKIIQMYQCEHKGCSHITADYNEALIHEANHYNIDLSTYQQWDLLKTKVKRLASNLVDHHNDDADKEYNDAVEKLIKFEADNGIGKKINADDDLEKAIINIFEKLDKYMGCKSFESINIDTIRFMINDFAKTRHLRDELDLEKDDELYEIEKKLRWLYSKMFNYGIAKINR